MDIFDVELANVVHSAAHLKIFYHEEKERSGMPVLSTLSDLEDYLKRRSGEETNTCNNVHLSLH